MYIIAPIIMHMHALWNYVHSIVETVHLNGEKRSPNMESYMLPCFHLILWQGYTSVFAVLPSLNTSPCIVCYSTVRRKGCIISLG